MEIYVNIKIGKDIDYIYRRISHLMSHEQNSWSSPNPRTFSDKS